MSIVGFIVRPRPDLGGVEVVPTVDQHELVDLAHTFEKTSGMEQRDISYGGLIPANYRFGPLTNHYLATGTAFAHKPGMVPLLGCECGEWGCWPLWASILRSNHEVIWTKFEQPFRPKRDYSSFGPFRFERNQYENALSELEQSIPSSD